MCSGACNNSHFRMDVLLMAVVYHLFFFAGLLRINRKPFTFAVQYSFK